MGCVLKGKWGIQPNKSIKWRDDGFRIGMSASGLSQQCFNYYFYINGIRRSFWPRKLFVFRIGGFSLMFHFWMKKTHVYDDYYLSMWFSLCCSSPAQFMGQESLWFSFPSLESFRNQPLTLKREPKILMDLQMHHIPHFDCSYRRMWFLWGVACCLLHCVDILGLGILWKNLFFNHFTLIWLVCSYNAGRTRKVARLCHCHRREKSKGWRGGRAVAIMESGCKRRNSWLYSKGARGEATH